MKPTKCSGAMKRNPRFGVLAVLLAATTIAVAEMRTWNFKSGATIEAEIVAFPGPDTVKVKRSDGKEYVLPTAYLASEDRAYLATERAKQWKEVSVDKLLGTAAAGRYKKCAVSGKDAGGNILIALLPASAEAVLNNRKQQEDQIADLSSQIQDDSSAARDAKSAAAQHGSRAYHNANRAQAKLATQDAAVTKASLDKLNADYAESVKKTKVATTVIMKNTGLVCEGLPVWECQTAQNRQ
jgi:hypothetical protein